MDAEPLRTHPGALDAHLAGCPGCASWLRSAEQVNRLTRLAAAPPLRDRTAEILARTPEVRVRGQVLSRMIRLLLAVVALAQAVLAYPDLVLGQDTMSSPMHVAHETGAWNAALAVAFLWVALRPRSASGVLPVAGAFVVLVLVVSLSDLASERVHLERAATHLLTTFGVLLLAALVWHRGRTHRPRLGGRGAGTDRRRVTGSELPPVDTDADWPDRHSRPASGAVRRGNVA